jgi:hypothetical protein
MNFMVAVLMKMFFPEEGEEKSTGEEVAGPCEESTPSSMGDIGVADVNTDTDDGDNEHSSLPVPQYPKHLSRTELSKAESRCFWGMVILEEVLLPQHTETMLGNHVLVRMLEALAKDSVPQLSAHLEQLGLGMCYVATAWFASWLAGMLPTPSLLRIWDVTLAYASKAMHVPIQPDSDGRVSRSGSNSTAAYSPKARAVRRTVSQLYVKGQSDVKMSQPLAYALFGAQKAFLVVCLVLLRHVQGSVIAAGDDGALSLMILQQAPQNIGKPPCDPSASSDADEDARSWESLRSSDMDGSEVGGADDNEAGVVGTLAPTTTPAPTPIPAGTSLLPLAPAVVPTPSDVAYELAAEVVRELKQWSLEPLGDQHLYELSLKIRGEVTRELEHIMDDASSSGDGGGDGGGETAPLSVSTPPRETYTTAQSLRKMDAKEAKAVIRTLLNERSMGSPATSAVATKFFGKRPGAARVENEPSAARETASSFVVGWLTGGSSKPAANPSPSPQSPLPGLHKTNAYNILFDGLNAKLRAPNLTRHWAYFETFVMSTMEMSASAMDVEGGDNAKFPLWHQPAPHDDLEYCFNRAGIALYKAAMDESQAEKDKKCANLGTTTGHDAAAATAPPAFPSVATGASATATTAVATAAEAGTGGYPLKKTDLIRFDDMLVASILSGASADTLEREKEQDDGRGRTRDTLGCLAQRMSEHLIPGKRMHRIHSYDNCLKVAEVVLWLQKEAECASDTEALALLNHMRQLSFVCVVKQDFRIPTATLTGIFC